MSEALDVITCLVLAGVLFPLGIWGRRHADSLVVDALDGEEREHRISVLRRGATTCQFAAGVFLLAAALLLFIR